MGMVCMRHACICGHPSMRPTAAHGQHSSQLAALQDLIVNP